MEDPTNYRRKYEDAVKRAEKEILACGSLDCDAARLIYRIFSEEFISEDERIRKDLISLLNSSINGKKVFSINDTTRKQMIAWLEKQGKKSQRMVSAEAKEAFYGMKTPLDKAIEEEVNAWLEKQGKPEDMGEVSDGYHTFNELYYYRMLYNAAFFNRLPKDWVHKSKRHHDGEECFGGGWFIVMANLPTGQISNHYELKDWDLFQIPEKDIADEWDGHTPQEAAERLHKFLLEKQGEEISQSDSKKLSEQIKDFEGEFGCWNSAQDFRPKHLQRCLCYDKYMKGVYCYVYDDISKYWCTQTTEEHDPDGDNHICDYADYRVTVWMSLPDTSFYPSKTLLDKQGEQNLVDKVEQKFKVGD